MKVIIVDHDEEAITQFEQRCETIPYVELKGKFRDARAALEYIASNQVEVVFFNVEINGMDGILFGEKIREINSRVVLIFFTEHAEYTLEMLRTIKADYYLLKPYTQAEINWVMGTAKLLVRRQKKLVYIRTFGRFDLFINGELVRFPNKKAKELLALCVDNRGGNVTMEEAIDKLWENRLYDVRVKNLYRKAVMDLNKIFLSYGIKDVFVKRRAVSWINYENVDRDYLKWIENKLRYLPSEAGVYMPEYSWAETTNARVNNQGINVEN